MCLPESARWKIERAQEHLELLRSRVYGYQTLDPYHLIGQPDPNPGTHLYEFRIDPPTPPFGVLVGALVHASRSALDHVAVAPVPGSTDDKSVYFPIFEVDPHTIGDPKARTKKLKLWSDQFGKFKPPAPNQEVRHAMNPLFLRIAFVLIGIALVACGGGTSTSPLTPNGSPSHPVGRQSGEVQRADAAPDENGPWQRLTIEGVSFEIPAGPEWRVDVVADWCSDQLERFVLMENQQTGDRIQVKFARKSVAAEFKGVESKLDRLTARVQASFSGQRVLEERLAKALPFPTNPACDPNARNDVPTLVPLETPPPQVTVIVEATWTPVTVPTPPPAP